MSETYTVSFHHGTTAVIGHNVRDPKFVRREAHIDPNGIHETWVNRQIEDAYKEFFGEALAAYNARQKRADRRIDDYLKHVRANPKLHDRYEFIAQIGNEKNHPDEKTARAILKEYHEDFIRRNGDSLKVIGAYYHADEIGGCPHIHEDYVPVARAERDKGKRQTGLDVRNNLTAALKELGYEARSEDNTDRGINQKTGKPYKKLVTAEMQFQAAEREALASIARKHGFEIEQPGRSPDEYCSSRQLRQARDIRMQNEARSEMLDLQETQLAGKELLIKNANRRADDRLKDAENREKAVADREKAVSERESGVQGKLKDIETREKQLNDRADTLEKKENAVADVSARLQKSVSAHKQRLEEYKNFKDMYTPERKRIEALIHEQRRPEVLDELCKIIPKFFRDVDGFAYALKQQVYNLQNLTQDRPEAGIEL